MGAGIGLCRFRRCALYPYRNGVGRKKRTRNISDAERERLREWGKRLGELNRNKKTA